MLIINLLIGLAIFLYGMMQLENGIQTLNSEWIKRWLKHHTQHTLNSVLTGTVVTAIVQSSSMISLIILAFASAGLIPLTNAIGVLLGANLGTTISGWIVATLGFKLNLDAVALPAIGLGALIQVFADRHEKLKAAGVLIFGLGLLLFGLSLMKTSVSVIPEHFNIEQLKHLNAISFLLLGTILTAIIQSSSATMMIALTALSAGMITLPGAAALVIGADLGTTTTTALGSLKGSPIKRQLALAHFIFNLVTNTLAFIILLPLLPTLMRWLTISDPLYSLVAFHSCFNVFGLCIFAPLLSPFSHWISQRFMPTQPQRIALSAVPAEVTEAAIPACKSHVKHMLAAVLAINLRNLRIEQMQLSSTEKALLNLIEMKVKPFEARYEDLKQREGELLQYVAHIQTNVISDTETKQIAQLLNCARDAVYAVKTLKDIRPNLIDLRHTNTPSLHHFAEQYQAGLKPFYRQLIVLLSQTHSTGYINEQLKALSQQNELLHSQLHQDIQGYSGKEMVALEQLSTLLNVNREIWQSNSSLIAAFESWFNFQAEG